MIRESPCYCGSFEFTVLRAISRASGLEASGRKVVQCRECGQVTRAPSLFDDMGLADSMPATFKMPQVFAADEHRGQARLVSRLQRAAELAPQKSILDLGAGSGSVLRKARTMGWDAVGVELDQVNRANIIDRGFQCFDEDICVKPLPGVRCGVVHANHVFEHLRDPLACLRNLRSMLMPSGIVIIEVPNEHDRLASILRRALGRNTGSQTSFLEHEWFYSPATLHSLLRRAGYDVLSLRTPRIAGVSPARSGFLAIEAVLNRGPVIEAWARRPAISS